MPVAAKSEFNTAAGKAKVKLHVKLGAQQDENTSALSVAGHFFHASGVSRAHAKLAVSEGRLPSRKASKAKAPISIPKLPNSMQTPSSLTGTEPHTQHQLSLMRHANVKVPAGHSATSSIQAGCLNSPVKAAAGCPAKSAVNNPIDIGTSPSSKAVAATLNRLAVQCKFRPQTKYGAAAKHASRSPLTYEDFSANDIQNNAPLACLERHRQLCQMTFILQALQQTAISMLPCTL